MKILIAILITSSLLGIYLAHAQSLTADVQFISNKDQTNVQSLNTEINQLQDRINELSKEMQGNVADLQIQQNLVAPAKNEDDIINPPVSVNGIQDITQSLLNP